MKSLWRQNSLSYCVKDQKPCVVWVNRFFKDCLCNLRDEFSFAFGLISLVCWAVAEIPQIVTNFRTKSSHGVSLLFLLTWVAGDTFNLVGCLLEPATLPTQFYTAVLYTVTTILLVLQSLYYDYIHKWWKGEEKDSRKEDEEDVKKPLRPPKTTDAGIPIPNGATRTPRRRDYYYTSARSLAGSATPPIRSYLWPVKSGPSAIGIDDGSSSDDETPETTTTKASISQPKPIPRSAGYGVFLATSVNMPDKAKAMMQVYIGISGRKLLQHGGGDGTGGGGGVVGQWLGWMMAAVYMGGRIPQIWLNIKRGSVEGLNPLMFIFALIANATYVASILVRTIEWKKIKANMPWLLDALACVVLDLFIILQYIYYKHFHKRSSRDHRHGGDDAYVAAAKE